MSAEVATPPGLIDPQDLSTYRALASQWAAELLADESVLLVDTETTTLYGQIIEIGVLDAAGRVVFERLVRPSESIAEEATRVHGLCAADLAQAPTMHDVADELAAVLRHRRLVAYKSSYDRTVLVQEERRIGRQLQPGTRWDCAMDLYAAWNGELVSDRTSFRNKRLPGAGHRAVDDCRSLLSLLRRVAGA